MTGRTGLPVTFELCWVRPAVGSATELLELMGAAAEGAGCVTAGFTAAVVERELRHPTGLPLPSPAAIPHSDPVHVLRPGLAVAVLDPPIAFGEMGAVGSTLDCHLAVMLLVDSPEEQVGVLGRVITLLQRPDWPQVLAAATDPADLALRFTALLD